MSRKKISLKEKIKEFMTDVNSKMDEEEAERLSEGLAKEITIISLTLILSTLLGILMGVGVEMVIKAEVPFYLLGLFPWATGTIGSIITYRWRGPKIRAFLKTYFNR